MKNQNQELKNENLSVSLKKEPGSHYVLDINVSPKATLAAFDKAVKLVNKEVSLPGFRKGKAPEDFILKNYGKQVDSEWRELVLQTAVQEALKLMPGVYPYRRDGIKCSNIKKISKDEGSSFTIEFEAAPQVPDLNLNDITLEHVDRPPVTQHEIEDVLTNLRFRSADWEDVTDHKVTEQDYVDLDIETIAEPKEVICENTRFAVKDMAPWMRKAIIGLKVGASNEATSEPTTDQENVQPTHCQITVKAIKKPILPEMDDQFAQKVGCKNLSELQERIVADLNRQADVEIQNKLSNQLDTILLDKIHFELPKSLIDEESENNKNDFTSKLKTQGASQEIIDKRVTEFEKSLPHQVENRYRLFYIYFTFAKSHNITANRDEVSNEISRQILQGARIPEGTDINMLYSRISQQILLRKVRDYIIAHVKRH